MLIFNKIAIKKQSFTFISYLQSTFLSISLFKRINLFVKPLNELKILWDSTGTGTFNQVQIISVIFLLYSQKFSLVWDKSKTIY